MCGIAGIVNRNSVSIDPVELGIMKNALKHRGPDDQKEIVIQNFGFAFCRLSILDLSSQSMQPFQNSNGSKFLVFNGEIYNFKSLKNELTSLGVTFTSEGDAEVLFQALILWGKVALHKLKGMFAFAYLDMEKNTILLARDRFGIKPLYFFNQGGKVAFSSEIKPLLNILNQKPTANQAVIANYLTYNRTDQNAQTFFNEINQIIPGHFIEFDLKNIEEIKQKKWYDLKPNDAFKDHSSIKTILQQSIVEHLQSDVPIALTLSGGIDSSIIATEVLSNTTKKSDAFSAIFPSFEFSEEKYIRNFENQFNLNFVTPNAEKLLHDLNDFVRTLEEPTPTTSPYAQYLVMREVGKKAKVVLSGQGADEQFAGYHYFYGFYLKELFLSFKWFRLLKESFAYQKAQNSTYAFKTFLFYLLPNFLKNKIVSAKLPLNSKWKKKHCKQLISDTLLSSNSVHEALLNHFHYKLAHLLKWEDKNSMRFSVESRVPFLDHTLVEASLSLNADQLLKFGLTKYILREEFKNDLPTPIITRKDKIGYLTPDSIWFKTKEWSEFIVELFESEAFKNRGIFDSEKAKSMYFQHVNGNKDYSKDIWKCVHLELWFREFID